jgi:hypothetical protein
MTKLNWTGVFNGGNLTINVNSVDELLKTLILFDRVPTACARCRSDDVQISNMGNDVCVRCNECNAVCPSIYSTTNEPYFQPYFFDQNTNERYARKSKLQLQKEEFMRHAVACNQGQKKWQTTVVMPNPNGVEMPDGSVSGVFTYDNNQDGFPTPPPPDPDSSQINIDQYHQEYGRQNNYPDDDVPMEPDQSPWEGESNWQQDMSMEPHPGLNEVHNEMQGQSPHELLYGTDPTVTPF